MAEGNEPRPPSCEIRTFTMDCNTTTSFIPNWYLGQRLLSDAEQNGASAIIPLWARKSGYGETVMLAYERNTIRLQSPISWTDVTVGLLYLYL